MYTNKDRTLSASEFHQPDVRVALSAEPVHYTGHLSGQWNWLNPGSGFLSGEFDLAVSKNFTNLSGFALGRFRFFSQNPSGLVSGLPYHYPGPLVTFTHSREVPVFKSSYQEFPISHISHMTNGHESTIILHYLTNPFY